MVVEAALARPAWPSKRTGSPSTPRASSTPASSKLSRTAATQYARPPLGEPQPVGCVRVGEPRAVGVERGGVVGGVDDAAREHVHAPEGGARVPAEHEHLERAFGVRAVSHEHHGGAVARRDGGGHRARPGPIRRVFPALDVPDVVAGRLPSPWAST